jgi:hypothetical protein
VSNALFGELVLRRVATEARRASPTSSSPCRRPPSRWPPQTGSTKTLDALDDRLFAATFRNGTLWSQHQGERLRGGDLSHARRRWYELWASPLARRRRSCSRNDLRRAASNPRFFFIPSVTVSGQGHAAFRFSTSGAGSTPTPRRWGVWSATPRNRRATQLYTNSTGSTAPGRHDPTVGDFCSPRSIPGRHDHVDGAGVQQRDEPWAVRWWS